MTDSDVVITEVSGLEMSTQEASLSLITKAEIDTQIATARAFPRSLSVFLKKVQSVATINENVAQSCTYSLVRGGKPLDGPSVRLAEIVVNSYQNVRAGARVISSDGKTITAQGIFHDLENNVCVTVEVKRRITDKMGRTYSEDMQVVTGNAACAIAFRNAVFKGVPSALIQDAYDEIKKVAKGSEKTLPERRRKTIEYLHEQKVTDAQICAILEVHAIEDIDLERLVTLRGMCTLIKNGESTAAELFSPEPPAAKDKAAAATDATIDAIKKTGDKAKAGKIEPK